MFQHLALDRPLAVIDLETTGTDPRTDRIVEICILKVYPDGRREQRSRRLNPGVPIPAAATAVHGIGDADVTGEPPFARVAGGLLDFLDGCDLCGFNLKKFDLPRLLAELRRAGRELKMDGRAVLDPLQIYHAFERRDLAAALRFYCGRDHDGAHGAAADARATAAVLDAMLARYAELPRDVAGLNEHFKGPDAVDANGLFRRVEGEVRFTFGRFRGQPLAAVAVREPDYLRWMLGQDFLEDTKQVVRDALARA